MLSVVAHDLLGTQPDSICAAEATRLAVEAGRIATPTQSWTRGDGTCPP